eukprot:6188447-Pleurochrysis_carterae.AAC.3
MERAKKHCVVASIGGVGPTSSPLCCDIACPLYDWRDTPVVVSTSAQLVPNFHSVFAVQLRPTTA